MVKTNFLKNYLLVFLFLMFLLSPVYTVFAALEVEYPEVSGQTLSAGSKLPELALYLFNTGMSIGLACVFISLTIAGIMYVLSPVNAGLKAKAKDRVGGAISGLLLLLLTYLIVTTINPAFAEFNLTKLPDISTPPAQEPIYPGVSFNGGKTKYLSSVPDLGILKNEIKEVKIEDDEYSSFITILYDKINFSGKCLYIANSKNDNLNWATSASIHQINDDPNGDGVYFYRKSYFDEKGGYLKIPNSKIKDTYVGELKELQFTGSIDNKDCNVPEEEMDCTKYDKNGLCCTEENTSLGCDKDGRVCPTLSGEEISSVKIKGDYIVLFVYYGPDDKDTGPWTSCQEFPTIDDVNKIGPQQIKWQNIRNGASTTKKTNNVGGVIPNYVIIVPI